MIDLKVSIDAEGVIGQLGVIADQIPYATSVAINNTLNDIQKAEREHIHSEFIMRRPDFIDRSVYIGPKDRARKDHLEGTVRINPERDVLAKFEDDTEKRSQGAAKLAVPVFREGDKGLVIRRSDQLSIPSLMRAIKKRAGQMKAQKGQKQKDVQLKAYITKNARGTFIIGRLGTETRVLYAFKTAVPIAPVLQFKEIAFNTAVANWETRAAEAIMHAIETAR